MYAISLRIGNYANPVPSRNFWFHPVPNPDFPKFSHPENPVPNECPIPNPGLNTNIYVASDPEKRLTQSRTSDPEFPRSDVRS